MAEQSNVVVLRGIPAESALLRRRNIRSSAGRLQRILRSIIFWSCAVMAHLVLAILLLLFVVVVIREPDGEGLVTASMHKGKKDLPIEQKEEAHDPEEDPPAEEPVELPEPAPEPVPKPDPKPKPKKTVAVPSLPTYSKATPYGSRGSGRGTAVGKFGGTAGSEAAVERGLDWLARHQEKNGSWKWSANCPEGESCQEFENGWNRSGGYPLTVGQTGLTVLAYLSAGYSHRKGKHKDTVDRAIRFLLQTQKKNGAFGWQLMYEQGTATLAVVEAFAMTRDPKLRAAAVRALEYIARVQTRSGGWDYYASGAAAEFTQSVWLVFALISARKAGLPVSLPALKRAREFVDRQTRRDGAVAYSENNWIRRSPACDAAGLFARMIMDVPEDRRMRMGLRLVNDAKIISGTDTLWLYGAYYKSLVLFQTQSPEWESWNLTIRDFLVDMQVREGHAAGSWPIQDDIGGNRLNSVVYTTTLSILILEVYYRYLPFYQRRAFSGIDWNRPEDPLPGLVRQLDTDSSSQRWVAARKLAKTEDKRALKPLLAAVRREKTDLAGSLLEFVAELGVVEAVPELVPYLADKRDRVRQGARKALRDLVGRDLGESPGPWKTWWERNRPQELKD